MDTKMSESIYDNRRKEIERMQETIKYYEWLEKLRKTDPEAYKKHMRKVKLFFVLILFICFAVFLWFRYYDACYTPDSFCDFVWWWMYGKKCYACSVKWLFYLEERKETIDSTCESLNCPDWTVKGCITWSRGQCKSCKCVVDSIDY